MASQVHSEDDLIDKSFQARSVHVYFLGLALILSGPVGDWALGLESGLWSYFLEFVLLSAAYLALVLCLAEMTSIVAFASGAYGYVRCSVGPFYGYMVACCELLENSFVSITCAMSVSQALTVCTGLSKHYEPLWLFLYYVASFAVQCRGGWYFWTAMVALGAATVLVVVVYCVAVLATADLAHVNLTDNGYERFVGGSAGFFRNFYRPMWMYIGTEAMTVSGKNLRDGPRVIPQTLVAAMLTAFALNVATIFATVVAFDGDGVDWAARIRDPLPLSFGFHRALQLPYAAGAALTLLPNFASGLGFVYASMHLTQAMSLSGLLPPLFQPTVGAAKVPLRALATTCVVQFVVAVVGWAASAAPPFYEVCVMAACVVYVGIFAAYVAFRVKFSNMARQFRSPVGVYGAAYGAALFSLTFVEAAIDTRGDFVAVVVGVVLLGAAAYYVAVAEARQFFSPEEQTRFMKAYIMNANKRRKSAVAGDRASSLRQQLAAWVLPRRRSHVALSGGSTKATLRPVASVAPADAAAATAAPALKYAAADDADGAGDADGGPVVSLAVDDVGGDVEAAPAPSALAAAAPTAAVTSPTVHATFDDGDYATESALDTLPL